MIKLPITEREFKTILKLLEKSGEKQLYAKLWSFNINQKENLWTS
jgi:hypothetical protein